MFDGIIVINKPKGCTSHDVVDKVKRLLNTKVGHTGTLDPNATGVLPLLIGKGTKLSYYLINHDKEYTVTLKLGAKTDTADSEGNVIEEKDVQEDKLEKDNIEEVLESFIGKQEQMPPMYSAIKVKGKKLYEYARKNEEVDIKARQIEIYQIQLISIDKEEKQIVFHVKTSKGTYVRSLCEDIASKLETVGYMKKLERTTVGNFEISDAITVQDLEEHKENQEFVKKHFITIEKFFEISNGLSGIKPDNKITLDAKKMELFLNGVQLTIQEEDGLYRIYNDKQEFIGIATIKNNLLKREIIVEN